MDMSEIGRTPVARTAVDANDERWKHLVSQMGAEIAAPLTAALERINELTSTGRIDRQGLRALRAEVESARQIGMIGQQLMRFATGRLRQSNETLKLDEVLDSVLAHRARETQSRGIVLAKADASARSEIIVDASMLFGLLNTLIDWALGHAQSRIELGVEIVARRARLHCRYDLAPGVTLDTLGWRLVEQTAWTLGLTVERRDAEAGTAVMIEFPRTVDALLEPVSALDLNDGFAPSSNSQPLAGSHVLVVASRREVRVQIRDALRSMSLIVDFVNNVDEAANFCRDGLPHAIIIEAIQNGERFGAFREDILAEVPGFVFIEIIEEGNAFQMSGWDGPRMAQVGRDVIASSLQSALIFELSKSLPN